MYKEYLFKELVLEKCVRCLNECHNQRKTVFFLIFWAVIYSHMREFFCGLPCQSIVNHKCTDFCKFVTHKILWVTNIWGSKSPYLWLIKRNVIYRIYLQISIGYFWNCFRTQKNCLKIQFFFSLVFAFFFQGCPIMLIPGYGYSWVNLIINLHQLFNISDVNTHFDMFLKNLEMYGCHIFLCMC